MCDPFFKYFLLLWGTVESGRKLEVYNTLFFVDDFVYSMVELDE